METKKSLSAVGISAIVLALVLGFGVFYFKEIYFPKFLKEDLKLSYKTMDLSLLTKTLTLNDVSYTYKTSDSKHENHAEKLVVIADSIGFITKEVNIEKVDITKLETIITDHAGNIVEPKFDLPIQDLTKGLSSLFLGVKVNEKNAYIDGQLLDQAISSNVASSIKSKLENEAKKIQDILIGLKEWESTEAAAKQKWTVNVASLTTTHTINNKEYSIAFENLTNKLSQMTKTINIIIKDKENNVDVYSTLFIPNLKLETKIESKAFDYKIIPNLEKYISSGKFEIIQNSTFENNILKIKGKSTGTEVKFNVETIINDIFKGKDLVKNANKIEKLRDIISKTESIKIDYSYDQELGFILIETDLKSQIKEILDKELVEEAKDELLDKITPSL